MARWFALTVIGLLVLSAMSDGYPLEGGVQPPNEVVAGSAVSPMGGAAQAQTTATGQLPDCAIHLSLGESAPDERGETDGVAALQFAVGIAADLLEARGVELRGDVTIDF